MEHQLGDFSKKLVIWYLQNKRDLPWRGLRDPYAIWLSEIMLQQTRVEQGLPYYNRFRAAFPTVQHLAEAPEEDVLKLWQGLGYYSRARNLHATAKYVWFDRGGEFPDSYSGLLELKGVGDYTASAIASICFDEPQAVVDGNVYRVLSRYFGVDEPIDGSSGKRLFRELAQQLIDHTQPGTYNQAIMEFGARQCVPRNPACSHCVLADSCRAKAEDRVDVLPFKARKTKTKSLYFNYLVVLAEDGRTLLNKRTEKGIWQNLYEFPLAQTDGPVGPEEELDHELLREIHSRYRVKRLYRFDSDPRQHLLSHRRILADFWLLETEAVGEEGVMYNEVQHYPVPVLVDKFLKECPVFTTGK